VSNHQLGHGFVWNAAPFLPVEGYTSFLWVVLLDWIWSISGAEPPESSNWLACLFGIGSLGVASFMVLKMRLCAPLQRYRNWFLCVVLLGLVTNTTFLNWTSSGLETALFNFLIAAWLATGLYGVPGSRSWIFGVALTGSLLALTRPDGLLIIASSAVLIAGVVGFARPRLPLSQLRFAFPLLLPLAHVLWRKSFYGEWLPNTYYAKHVSAWPEAGIRYLASFVLEFGLWLWILLALGVALHRLRQGIPKANLDLLRDLGVMVPLIMILTVAAHFSYYTFIIGGDHFGYRVYSYTVPLILVTGVWMVNRLVAGAKVGSWAVVIPGLMVALAQPIPWTHWVKAKDVSTRQHATNMAIPLASFFPPGTRWYVAQFDTLQKWLIDDHSIAKRRREHEVFLAFQRASFPRERLTDSSWKRRHWVLPAQTVGVPGWILPHAHIIDTLGLNDYVTARSPVSTGTSRQMAHDRISPPAYVKCFKPNLKQGRSRLLTTPIEKLDALNGPKLQRLPVGSALTTQEIIDCEAFWRRRIGRSPAQKAAS
jgi:arabinofuranosyltransferase